MTISKDDALEAARREAAARGWRWEEPIAITRVRSFILFGHLTYEVRTNAEMLGQNGRFVIDGETGAVLKAHWLPR
jgi:hypothetical protein